MLTKSISTVCHLSTKIVRMICACVTGFIKTIVASTVITSVRSSCDKLARNTHLYTYYLYAHIVAFHQFIIYTCIHSRTFTHTVSVQTYT